MCGLSFAVWCFFNAVSSVSFVVRCSLFVARCVLFAVRCLSFVMCCLFLDVRIPLLCVVVCIRDI